MAYMDTPWYIWSDGTHMHIARSEPEGFEYETVAVPLEVFDALVVMRHAQLLEERRETPGRTGMDEYSKEIAERYAGNMGADALRRIFGLKDTMATAREAIADLERPPDT